MLDIRLPIGAMFALLGVMLALYGLFTPAEMYRVSLGHNLNLIWGGAMALFGGGMLLWMLLRPESGPDVREISTVVPTAPQEQRTES